jgi:hypothetical protein
MSIARRQAPVEFFHREGGSCREIADAADDLSRRISYRNSIEKISLFCLGDGCSAEVFLKGIFEDGDDSADYKRSWTLSNAMAAIRSGI